ncbi:MAG: signal peptidase II [Vampirovibrionales bacterium]|jgi:signal peptidase II
MSQENSLQIEENTTNTESSQPCVTHRVLSPKLLLWMAVFDVLSVDATLKWIFSQQPLGKVIEIIPNVFNFQHVENTGVAFSFLKNQPQIASLLSGALLGTLIVLVIKQKLINKTQALGFGFVIGGGLNNALDRLLTGAVTDYIHLPFLHFPIFNLSDAMIFIGAILIFYHYLWAKAPTKVTSI